MSRYKLQKALVRDLERQAMQLEQQAHALQQECSLMHLKHHLLSAWCEGLAIVKQCVSGREDTAQVSEDSREVLAQLLEQECCLLLELAPNGAARAQPAAAAAAGRPACPRRQQEQQQQQQQRCSTPTLASADDPLAFFFEVMRQPLLPDAASITPEGLARLLNGLTMQVSMQLHLLNGLTCEQQRQEKLELIRALWTRYGHAMSSVAIVGRPSVVDALNITNMQSGVVDTEGASRLDQRVPDLVPLLGLSAAQQERIAAGAGVLQALMEPVRLERQRLQAEGARSDLMSLTVGRVACCGDDAHASGTHGGGGGGGAGATASGADSPQQQQHHQQQQQQGHVHGCCAPTSSSSCSFACGGDAAGGTSASVAAAASGSTAAAASGSARSNATDAGGRRSLESLAQRQKQLQAEQQHIVRLQQVLHKEYVLRMVGACWFAGCLSVQQLSKAAVLCWPFFFRPMLLASEVHRQHRLQQQQQQQQQQRQQQQRDTGGPSQRQRWTKRVHQQAPPLPPRELQPSGSPSGSTE